MLTIAQKGSKKALPPARQLTYNLHKSVFLLDKIADLSLQQALRLSFSQFLVLLAIDRASECPQGKVAQYLDLTEAAVSRQAVLLRRKKWLQAKSNPQNRREHLLSFTSTGRAVFQKALAVLERRFSSVYRILSAKERRSLEGSLEKLIGHIHSRDLKSLCGRGK